MDKPVLVIEAPELNDEAAAIVLDFLQEFINAFDVHFYHRLQRHKQLLHRARCSDEAADNEDPF